MEEIKVKRKRRNLYTVLTLRRNIEELTVSMLKGREPIYKVLACSVEQAYWLARKQVWFDGRVGMLEKSLDLNARGLPVCWLDYRHRHGPERCAFGPARPLTR